MCALIAAADGSIDPEERRKVAGLIGSNEVLQNFPADQLQAKFNEYCDKLTADFDFGKVSRHPGDRQGQEEGERGARRRSRSGSSSAAPTATSTRARRRLSGTPAMPSGCPRPSSTSRWVVHRLLACSPRCRTGRHRRARRPRADHRVRRDLPRHVSAARSGCGQNVSRGTFNSQDEAGSSKAAHRATPAHRAKAVSPRSVRITRRRRRLSSARRRLSASRRSTALRVGRVRRPAGRRRRCRGAQQVEQAERWLTRGSGTGCGARTPRRSGRRRRCGRPGLLGRGCGRARAAGAGRTRAGPGCRSC